MESTFDLRNGKTLNKKVISFDGTLLSESFLKPLFGIYNKYRGFLDSKMIQMSNMSYKKIDVSEISDNIKLKLTNKRAMFIFLEETIIEYPTKDNPIQTPKTRINYRHHRIYSDKDIRYLQSKGNNKGLDNLIRNSKTSLDVNRFSTYYIVDGFYVNGASNGMASGKTLRDYINVKYDENTVVKDIIYNEL
jgi:hypothetical protein